MKHRHILWVAAALALALLGGCGAAPAASGQAGSAADPAATPAPTAAPTPAVASVTLTPPEGFSPMDLTDAEALAGYQAQDGSSILIHTSKLGQAFSFLTQQSLADAMLARYQAQYADAAMTVTAYAEDPVLGCEARRVDVTVTAQGQTVSQTLLLINAAETYTYTFTDLTADGSHAQAFADCIAGLQAVMGVS